jgi:hypothetical protein
MAISNFKLVIDLLASFASIVAIVSVLVSWHRNTRRPLRIKNVYIERDSVTGRIRVEIINRKNYPITINSIRIYHKKINQLVIKAVDKYYHIFEFLTSDDELPIQHEEREIEPNASKKISVFEAFLDNDEANFLKNKISSLFFVIHTSHGIIVKKTRKIRNYDHRKVELVKEYPSNIWFPRVRSRAYLAWLKITSCISKDK